MQLLNKWGKEWWKFSYWLRNFLINDCRTFQPVTCELSIQQKRVDVSVLVNVVAKHWETLLPFTVELKGLVKPTNMKETVPIIQVVSSVLEQWNIKSLNSLSNGGERWSQKLVLGRYVGKQVDFVVIQICKKIIYIIVVELKKLIKKSMVTGVAQKSCTALFPLWSFGKMIYLKWKKKKKR